MTWKEIEVGDVVVSGMYRWEAVAITEREIEWLCLSIPENSMGVNGGTTLLGCKDKQLSGPLETRRFLPALGQQSPQRGWCGMKCLQTVNIYGLDLETVRSIMINSGSRPKTELHDPFFHEVSEGVNCDRSNCLHHVPIYDEFREWVDEVREQELPK